MQSTHLLIANYHGGINRDGIFVYTTSHAFYETHSISFMHRSSDTGKKPDVKAVADEPTPVMIRISTRTQGLLDSLKEQPDESYDAVILRLCDRDSDDDAPLSDETLKKIEESLAELQKGISHTHEKIVKELVAGKKK